MFTKRQLEMCSASQDYRHLAMKGRNMMSWPVTLGGEDDGDDNGVESMSTSTNCTTLQSVAHNQGCQEPRGQAMPPPFQGRGNNSLIAMGPTLKINKQTDAPARTHTFVITDQKENLKNERCGTGTGLTAVICGI